MRRIREPTISADYRRKLRRQMVSNKQGKSEKEIKVMAKSTEIKYECVKKIGKLGEDSKKELRIVKWNDRDAKLDLRDYWEKDGEEKYGKGVTLTNDEAKVLAELLNDFFAEQEDDGDDDF